MRTLIARNSVNLQPIGGSSGYLFDMYQEKVRLRDREICFLESASIREFAKKIIKPLVKKPQFGGDPVNGSKAADALREIYRRGSSRGRISFSEFDMVHFHTTADMYMHRVALEDYEGLVLLTSHSPMPTYQERILYYLDDNSYLKDKELFDSAESIDEFAFSRANYVVFPCPQAEEPYINRWDKYSYLRDERKLRYVETGIVPVHARKSRESIRANLGLHESDFLISYVGRHEDVKGYDRLIAYFKKLAPTHQNIAVVCCGRQKDMYTPPSTDRWIEVGWTDDPYSYVAASDLFILPNRETYFDICLLQAMSLGKCALLSNTGGNKVFSGMQERGIWLFDTDEQACELIKMAMDVSPEDRGDMEERQRSLFFERFDIRISYQNYKKLLHSILNQETNI